MYTLFTGAGDWGFNKLQQPTTPDKPIPLAHVGAHIGCVGYCVWCARVFRYRHAGIGIAKS